MKTTKRAHIFLVVLAWVTIFPTEAMAYLDPGTGSLIVQSVIAALAAAGFAIRLYWGRIRLVFHRPRVPAPLAGPPAVPPKADS
jgi:hypothetical protein